MMQSDPHVAKRCSVNAGVVRCTPVCREHVAIDLTVADLPPSQPGQFLQLLCRDAESTSAANAEWPSDGFPSLCDQDSHHRRAYLRRPFSIADRWQAPDGQDHVCVISRTVGVGTEWLERLRPGDTLNLTGPLGHGFRIPRDARPLILVGGGVGIPPLLYLIRQLPPERRARTLAVFGVTTRDLLPLDLHDKPAADGTPRPCVRFPADAQVATIITTDDGSLGLRGRVTDGLQRGRPSRAAGTPPPLVCACGPEAMLKAVANWAHISGMECQLCIERNMGCGVGTCLSCVVRVRDADRPEGWRWALTCTDGPVFDRAALIDYTPAQRA